MRRFKEGDVVEVKTIAQTLNSMPVGVEFLGFDEEGDLDFYHPSGDGLILVKMFSLGPLTIDCILDGDGAYDYTADGFHWYDWMFL